MWGRRTKQTPLELGFKKVKPAWLPWLKCLAMAGKLKHGPHAESTASVLTALSLLQVARKTEAQGPLMAGVLGEVALETDSKTKICTQETDEEGVSETRPGREAGWEGSMMWQRDK